MTLTAMECSALTHAEAIIEQSAAEFGKALAQIRDERLYRAEHATFEDYCLNRWGISRAHAYRAITMAEVAHVMSPIGDIPESQARELAPLRDDPERMREVYAEASEATGGKPTAEAIRAVRTLATPHAEARPTPEQVEESAAATRTMLAAIDERLPNAAAERAQSSLKARWSRLISATAEINTMNAENVSAVISTSEFAAAQITSRELAKFISRVEAARSQNLRIVRNAP